MSYKRTVSELRQKASIFWPTELSRKAFERSVIPALLETQEQFIAFLTVSMPDVDTLLEFIDRSNLPPDLFLKHLVVLTDFGGEMLQRVNQFYDVLFPAGTMEYKWGQGRRVYKFKALPVSGQLTTKRLNLDGSDLLKKTAMSDLTQDVITLLILGGVCTDERVAATLEKCVLGQYLGDPDRVQKHIKQQTMNLHRFDVAACRGGKRGRSFEVRTPSEVSCPTSL